MALEQHKDAAAAFLQDYPLGTKVRGEEIIAWAQDHADGLASDLLIGDDGKKLSALRRHLNSGAASREFAEAERYVIDIEDAKRKVFVIRQLAEFIDRKSTVTFSKSVNGALAPIKASQRAIDDLKLDELDEDLRKSLEQHRKEQEAAFAPMKRFLNQQAIDRWVLRLEADGYTKDQALALMKRLPTYQQEMKILRATS